MQKLLMSLLVATGLGIQTTASATTYLLPLPGNEVVGQVQFAYAQPGQSIDDVARQYDVGFYEILAANPHVNPQNLMPYQKLVIPSQFILPANIRNGIVVNTAELRLYYFPPNRNVVETYPIAIGMLGSATPAGSFTIIEKIKHPAWRVPADVQAFMARQGTLLPKVIPAGPDNPLGDYALRLNNYTYLIHGTNVPATVGRRASAGCMHMFPEDIEYLFPQVSKATAVTIIDQPFLAGWSNGQLYFKAEQPLIEARMNMAMNYSRYWNDAVQSSLVGMTDTPKIDWKTMSKTGKEQTGIPAVIATLDL